MLAQDERLTSPQRAVSQPDGTSPAARLPRPRTVKAGLTPKRPRRQIENDEYGAFVRRILRAYSRRVGDGDVEALALMLGLAEEIDTAIAEAVKDLRRLRLLLGRDRLPARASPARPPSNAGATVSTAVVAVGTALTGDPAQIPMCGITALGSYHGWLAAKRCSG